MAIQTGLAAARCHKARGAQMFDVALNTIRRRRLRHVVNRPVVARQTRLIGHLSALSRIRRVTCRAIPTQDGVLCREGAAGVGSLVVG